MPRSGAKFDENQSARELLGQCCHTCYDNPLKASPSFPLW